MKLASIDIGSNSVRHLTVEEEKGILKYVSSSSQITRVTEGIQEGSTLLKDSAVDRTERALVSINETLDAEGVDAGNRHFFATESLRAASNCEEVVQKLRRTTVSDIEIISGTEEARRSFIGATSSFGRDSLVFDLGGGSMEISTETENFSYPIGAVRTTNLFGTEHPEKVRQYVLHAIEELGHIPVKKVIGVGGTSSSIAMMLKGIEIFEYTPSLIHGYEIHIEDLFFLLGRFASLPHLKNEQIGLDPLRRDIIDAGMCTVYTLLRFLGVSSYIHSETGLLWGTMIRLLAKKDVEFKGIVF